MTTTIWLVLICWASAATAMAILFMFLTVYWYKEFKRSEDSFAQLDDFYKTRFPDGRIPGVKM